MGAATGGMGKLVCPCCSVWGKCTGKLSLTHGTRRGLTVGAAARTVLGPVERQRGAVEDGG